MVPCMYELSDHHLAALSGHMSDILYLGELKLAIRNTQCGSKSGRAIMQNAKRNVGQNGLRDRRNTQYVIRNTE